MKKVTSHVTLHIKLVDSSGGTGRIGKICRSSVSKVSSDEYTACRVGASTSNSMFNNNIINDNNKI